MLRHVVWQILTDVPEVLTASIIRVVMKAESTSETSQYLKDYMTQHARRQTYLYIFCGYVV
jgi:hypothetical protein